MQEVVNIQSLHRGWVLGHTSLIGQYSPFGSSFEFLFMEEWGDAKQRLFCMWKAW